MNKTLVFISVLLVSLFVIGAVSAAENVTEDVVISDVDDTDVISVDNEEVQVSTDLIEKESIVKDGVTTGDESNSDAVGSTEQGTDSDTLGDGDDVVNSTDSTGQNSSTGSKGTGIDFKSLFNGTTFSFGNGTNFNISDLLNGTTISFGNGTSFNISDLLNGNISFGNGTSFNISSLLNGTGLGNGTFNISGILDMFGGNTKKETITTADLTTYYSKSTIYKVTVKNGDTPLTSGSVIFTIDNKEYVGRIGSDGVASVSVNLKPGKHYVIAEYGDVLAKGLITVKKSIITKDVTKKVKKTGKFTVKILNKNGKAYAKQIVKVKFKGKTYKLKTNKKGIATLKLTKKIKAGKYTVKTTYAGLTVTNKITVKK